MEAGRLFHMDLEKLRYQDPSCCLSSYKCLMSLYLINYDGLIVSSSFFFFLLSTQMKRLKVVMKNFMRMCIQSF